MRSRNTPDAVIIRLQMPCPSCGNPTLVVDDEGKVICWGANCMRPDTAEYLADLKRHLDNIERSSAKGVGAAAQAGRTIWAVFDGETCIAAFSDAEPACVLVAAHDAALRYAAKSYTVEMTLEVAPIHVDRYRPQIEGGLMPYAVTVERGALVPAHWYVTSAVVGLDTFAYENDDVSRVLVLSAESQSGLVCVWAEDARDAMQQAGEAMRNAGHQVYSKSGTLLNIL